MDPGSYFTSLSRLIIHTAPCQCCVPRGIGIVFPRPQNIISTVQCTAVHWSRKSEGLPGWDTHLLNTYLAALLVFSCPDRNGPQLKLNWLQDESNLRRRCGQVMAISNYSSDCVDVCTKLRTMMRVGVGS